MNTSFSPGQLTFKPKRLGFERSISPKKASPLPRSASSPWAADIKAQRLEIDKLKGKLRALEDKRKQTLSPVYRQGADAQIKAIKTQIQKSIGALAQLRSKDRAHCMGQWLQEEPPQETLRAHLEKLYFQPKIFPTENAALAMRGLVQILLTPPAQPQDAFENAFSELNAIVFFTDSEKQHLRKLSAFLLPDEPSLAVAVQAPIEAPPEETPEAPVPLALLEEERGDLEVSFDFSAGKSKVQNKMGITLNQPKKTYQAYLDEGFAYIDTVVKSEFTNLSPLQEAIASFLEAVHLNKEQHEAYFGLGYLYSLVRDLNYSIYFLDIAYKISGDTAILTFMNKVKQTYGVQ